uniref:Polymorphic toxin-type HINT domain-containing protein n=1 Tax=Streptomyces sp. NBC_00003 TaxID=2903608 RepID=A0AAU2UXA4_9ACTN
MAKKAKPRTAAKSAPKRSAKYRSAPKQKPKPQARPKQTPKLKQAKPQGSRQIKQQVKQEVKSEAKEQIKEQVKEAAGPQQGDSCRVNSFVPGTTVLMADGSRKPIEEIKTGDKVMATDPETGETKAEPVVATIIGQGSKDLVKIAVRADGDQSGDQADSGALIATDGHPFWVPDRRARSRPLMRRSPR